MKSSKWVNAVGAVLLLAAAGVVSASSAHAEERGAAGENPLGPTAADWFQMHTDDDNPGGVVQFVPEGDLAVLLDLQDDGKDVQLDVWNATRDPNSYEYRLRTRGGITSSDEGRASMGQPWNLAEGDCFRFRIRLVEPGTAEDVVPGSTDYAQWRNVNGAVEECSGVD